MRNTKNTFFQRLLQCKCDARFTLDLKVSFLC